MGGMYGVGSREGVAGDGGRGAGGGREGEEWLRSLEERREGWMKRGVSGEVNVEMGVKGRRVEAEVQKGEGNRRADERASERALVDRVKSRLR